MLENKGQKNPTENEDPSAAFKIKSVFVSIFCMEGTSYVLSFRMVFFYLVTTGWIFDISLCENSINQKNKYIHRHAGTPSLGCGT